MKDYQYDFIKMAIDAGVLRFGEFTLKSGRQSPYFFNLGNFYTGAHLEQLASAYVSCLLASKIPFDGLFGPAYKGIPIVSATALLLHRDHGLSVPYTYDRKEAKTHGEGGLCVGAPLSGNIVLLDDVMTAGTAVSQCQPMIEAAGATLSGVVIALDRQERGTESALSAVQMVQERYGVPVASIIQLTAIREYLERQDNKSACAAIDAYQKQWGTKN